MAMTFRTDAELDRMLTELAQSTGASRQEVIRRAIVDMHQREGHASLVADSTERMVARWGDVLDRLGSV